MKKLSGVIITHNEEEKVRAALTSLKSVCDEVVVVDSGSDDSTLEICREYAEKVISHEWEGYRKQKQFATDQASFDWILSLDADEKLSRDLEGELLRWKESEIEHAGFLIPRLTWFMGRWIRHTSWYPDLQLRLFDRRVGYWEGGHVHESVEVDGSVGRLKGHILHFTYSTTGEYLDQLQSFSELWAIDNAQRERNLGIISVGFLPILVFLKNYLVKRGFLDGIAGLCVSYFAAASTFFKLLKLREKRIASTRLDWISVAPESDDEGS